MRRNTARLLRNLTTILYRRRMLFMSEHIFHRRVQKEGETAEAFIRNLYELAEHCKFGKQRDEQIQAGFHMIANDRRRSRIADDRKETCFHIIADDRKRS